MCTPYTPVGGPRGRTAFRSSFRPVYDTGSVVSFPAAILRGRFWDAFQTGPNLRTAAHDNRQQACVLHGSSRRHMRGTPWKAGSVDSRRQSRSRNASVATGRRLDPVRPPPDRRKRGPQSPQGEFGGSRHNDRMHREARPFRLRQTGRLSPAILLPRIDSWEIG